MMPDEGGDETIRLGNCRESYVQACSHLRWRCRCRASLSGSRAVFSKNPCSRLSIPISTASLVSDRAQMARNLKATLVCRLDRGTQFLARDMRIGLERGHTAIRPKISRSLAHPPAQSAPASGGFHRVRLDRARSRPDVGPGSVPLSIARLSFKSVYGSTPPVVRMVVTPLAKYRRGARSSSPEIEQWLS